MSTMIRRKRRAAAGSDIKSELDDVQDFKRKRKLVTHYDPEAMCQELYDIIRNHRTEDGRLLCESFVRVPKRRTEPTYYEIVTNPIDMLKIQHKIKSEEYDDVDVFAADFQLMLDNARAYYKAGSREADDADSLWQLLVTTKDRLVTEAYGLTDTDTRMDDGASVATSVASESADNATVADENSLPSPVVKQEISNEARHAVDPLELFAAVATATDGSRCITDIFKVLPSRKRYPEYFEIIKEPIDLRTIAQKLEDKSLTSTDDLIKAFTLMLNNAKTFNEPGSQIYKDATTLKKLVASKRHDLSLGSRSGVEGAAEVCATIAHLPSSDDDGASSSDEEEPVSNKDDSPLWTLYKAVRQHKDNTGYRLSEPFVKLPNKRQYPDYYQEIKQPMCLVKIRKKLDGDSYADIEELSADLSLLFDNAQQYNIEDSKIYKDAGKLRTVMKNKKKELSGNKVKVKDEMTRVRQDSASNMSDDGTLRTRRMTTSATSAKKPAEDNLRKKLLKLYRAMTQHEVDGRRISVVFSELPSEKEYPDYYQVIAEPIDLKEIEHRIKTDKYEGEGGLVSDLELMLKNAKCYNEESSQIYADAEELDKVLKTATKDWALVDTRASKGAKLKLKALNPLQGRLQEIYNAVRDFADMRGRLLALPFAKLPSKTEYPDYYEVIKKPIDMQRISQRISQSQYENVEELISDFVLMFDNACKYNESDSLIYKDALTLQRVCLEKKQELANADDSSGLPDVNAAVQEILLKLFESTYNHKDEEERCLSDSFLELPSYVVDKIDGHTESPRKRLTFERIKRSLNKGCYKRLDTFQDDMLEVFTYARSISRTDSQLYEDAVELEQWFVRERDDLCRSTLLSPALSYTLEDVQKDVDSERKDKLAHEVDERKADPEKAAEEGGADTEEAEWQGVKYTIGDFVYVEPREAGMQSHIMCVERLHHDASGSCQLHGTWFFRPAETFHLATHKFLVKEVVRSDYNDNVPLTKVMGKCCVMFVKDYYHLQPQGFNDDDVYVCESRYSTKTKLFKKIKVWQVPDSSVKLVPREQALTPMRKVLSVVDKAVDGGSEDETEDAIERKRENVLTDGPDPATGEDKATFYEQYHAPCGWLKTGDFAYKKCTEGRPSIIRIDKIWTIGSGEGYVSGPRFMYPHEVDHQPNRVFYKNELFKSDSDVRTPLTEVSGRCSVLSLKDYCSSRLTDICEDDVYVCESKYTSNEKLIRRIVKPVKKHSLSLVVCDDEVYFFKKPIVPTKEPSPLLLRVSSHDLGQEDSNMSSDRVMSATPIDTISHDLSISDSVTDSISQKKKSSAKFKSLSGYIVFSGECRKEIQAANPDMSFGDISRLVGLRWRSLPKDEKDRYEARVKKILEEQAANEEAQKQATPQQVAAFVAEQPPTYMCPPPPPIPLGVMPFYQPDVSSGSMSQHAPIIHGQQAPPSATAMAPQARPPSPMFIAVPPRSQRLLHSETYLRYIEGLTPTNQNVSNWRRAVQQAPIGPLRDSAALRLPTQWLGTSAMHHNSATEALWALRDLMLKDTVNIVKYNDL